MVSPFAALIWCFTGAYGQEAELAFSQDALPFKRMEETLQEHAQQNDQDDILAAKLMLSVFHFYCQWNQGDKSLDLTKPVAYDYTVLKYTLSFYFPAVNLFSDWQFWPIEGHLGFYAALKFFGRPHKELFGVVGYHPASHTIAIIFRGSLSASDYFFSNFNMGVKFPLSQRVGNSVRDWGILEGWHNLSFEGPVHAGYYNRILTCQDSLYLTLRTLLNRSDSEKSAPRLLITGHSMGGASAALLAGVLASEERNVPDAPLITENKLRRLKPYFSEIKLVSFGAPRVSDGTYGQWLQHQSINVRSYETEGDVITTLPPYQLHEKLTFSAYAPLIEAIKLSSYGICHPLAVHDPRLYWYALAERLNIDQHVYPFFKLSINSALAYWWSGLEEVEVTLNIDTAPQSR